VSVLITSLVALAGLWYSSVQTQQVNEEAQQDRALAKEGQVTDRYTAAVNNLGNGKMDVRLGGIYALQRIMQDSIRDQPTIANVLATYIRTHAAKPPTKGQDIPADIQAPSPSSPPATPPRTKASSSTSATAGSPKQGSRPTRASATRK
jgi:hypothetical protein